MASAEEVQKLAKLARLRVSDEELPQLAGEFDSILAYVGKLDELKIDVSSTPEVPTTHNVFRPDGEPHAAGKYTEAIAAQFPQRSGDSLSVKQIITHE